MYIQQISVYLENTQGTLLDFARLLGEQNVNMLAISIADAAGFGIVRCIVNSRELDKTLQILRENGYIAKTNRVVGVRFPHRPNAFAYVLGILNAQNLSVEYAYSFCRSTQDDAVMILRPSEIEAGAQALADAHVTFVTQSDVDAF